MFNINQKFENFFPVSLKNYKAQIFPIIKNDILMFKEKGVVRTEGKNYEVKDGDIILFRFNV